jgi:hypothetical protein
MNRISGFTSNLPTAAAMLFSRHKKTAKWRSLWNFEGAFYFTQEKPMYQ